MPQPGSDTVLYRRVPRHLWGQLQSMQQQFTVPSCKYCGGKRQEQCQASIGLAAISWNFKCACSNYAGHHVEPDWQRVHHTVWRVFLPGQNILSSKSVVIPASCTQAFLLKTSETTTLATADPCQPTVSTLLHDPIAKAQVPLQTSERSFQCLFLILSPFTFHISLETTLSFCFFLFHNLKHTCFPEAWAHSWDNEWYPTCPGQSRTQNQAFLIRETWASITCLLCSGLTPSSGQWGM